MSTAAPAQLDQAQNFSAEDDRTSLPLRGDTFLGVFEAIGSDLGFNPNWLRIAFATLLLWNPEVIVAAYLLLGVVVAAARWMFPVEARPAAKAAPAQVEQDVEEKREEEELLAA